MASIIKAADRNRGISESAFNFDDMQTRADDYLRQVREQATRIVAEAQKQAEQIRKTAELEGLKAARRAHDAEVAAETAKRIETLAPALRAAVDELQASKQAWLAHWERTAVGLACRIAERIVRRELAADHELPLRLVRESLELAVGADGVRIALNPADAAKLGDAVGKITREFARMGTIDVAVDERIAPGGCRLETRHGVIDQQLATQLARIEEELT
jgi:flagellar biosynthesis/type III secretory pathway protein FliH